MDTSARLPKLIRNRICLIVILCLISWDSLSQSCSCPPINTCNACAGGLTQLSFRYTGSLRLVTVSDGGGILFSGVLNNGNTFSITSSSAGQPFVGGQITLNEALIGNTIINTTCATQVFVGSVFGNFVVTAGASFSGGTICCEIMETTPPVISGCPSNINLSSSTASCGAIVNWTAPTVSDNCGVLSFTSNHSPGDFFSVGTTTVTYQATDNYGNTSSCSFNVNVSDNTNPSFSGCPSNINLSANASCQATTTWTPPTASDNCAVSNVTSTHSPGDTFPLGTTTVTYTATDAAGNVSACSFNVIVSDNVNPTISGCPSNINVSANASCQAVVNWTAPTASDNCSIASFTSTHSSGATFTLGTTTVTYTATDGSGNVATCSFNVIVTDNTNPVITGCPSTINLNANASCQAVADWAIPTVSDNCSISGFTSSHDPGATFPLGTTTVTYTATDGSDNITTCSFNVVVSDNTNPVITGCPSNINVNADASCQAVVNWTAPTASDNCSVASFTGTRSPGSTFPIGTTIVTYTAIDGAGNVATCSFKVTVSDNINPVITGCPSNINVSANASCQAVVNWTAPTASDNCSITSFTSTHSSGATFALGTTTVTYTATDGAGNTTTCSFNVVVKDNTAPVISNCPASITVDANPSQCGATVSWTAPTASDLCSGPVTFSSSHNPGDFFSVGTPTTVTYTFSDAAGNNAICSFTVTVNDRTAPQFQNCPQNMLITINDACEATANWTAPTASDNCTVASVTSSHQHGDTFPIGTTEVTYEAMDNAGNKTSCKFLVTVRTQDAPVITGCPADITAVAGESGKVAVFWEPPTASSRCGAVELVGSHEPGMLFPVGTTKVSYTIANDASNVVRCSFNITVNYEELVIEVVNVITPNGDNVNDVLIIPNIEKFKDNRVTIVDRWGSVLYQATGYNNGSVSWKGTNASGTNVPTGTYFYIIEVTFRDKRIEKRGFIELIQ
jgi:large repetitive protein